MVINGRPQEAVFPSFSFDKLLFLSCLSEAFAGIWDRGHYQGTDSFLVETYAFCIFLD